MPDTAPYSQVLRTTIPNTAAGSDYDQTVDPAPFDATVTAVTYVPEAAITGANTETRTHTLVNKGQSGAGSTVIATLAWTSGVNGVAFDEKPFTLSGTAANLDVASGDVLAVVSTHSGATGLADPGGRVEVTISRR